MVFVSAILPSGHIDVIAWRRRIVPRDEVAFCGVRSAHQTKMCLFAYFRNGDRVDATTAIGHIPELPASGWAQKKPPMNGGVCRNRKTGWLTCSAAE
jgi:hypothetical protein